MISSSAQIEIRKTTWPEYNYLALSSPMDFILTCMVLVWMKKRKACYNFAVDVTDPIWFNVSMIYNWFYDSIKQGKFCQTEDVSILKKNVFIFQKKVDFMHLNALIQIKINGEANA